MPDRENLNSLLHEHGIRQASPAVRNPTDPNSIYVFIEIIRNEKNLQVPANTQLHKIREALKENGSNVDFVLIDASTRDAEAGVRATLLHHLGHKIRNSFMSVDNRLADIWIVPKSEISTDDLTVARDRVAIFLENVGLKLRKLTSLSDENTPTKSACLSILRSIAPADLQHLLGAARDRGFVIPSDDWMSRMLDSLRKSGLITRLKNGSYALTLAGLKAGGTAKNARSPDVRRLLDLARRAR